jgi:predicted nucleic acid-binding Zn ribbon protein
MISKILLDESKYNPHFKKSFCILKVEKCPHCGLLTQEDREYFYYMNKMYDFCYFSCQNCGSSIKKCGIFMYRDLQHLKCPKCQFPLKKSLNPILMDGCVHYCDFYENCKKDGLFTSFYCLNCDSDFHFERECPLYLKRKEDKKERKKHELLDEFNKLMYSFKMEDNKGNREKMIKALDKMMQQIEEM